MRVPDLIQEELDMCDVPWKIVSGRKHHKIFIGSRLAGILPHGVLQQADKRSTLNVRAQIRRAIQKEKHQ